MTSVTLTIESYSTYNAIKRNSSIEQFQHMYSIFREPQPGIDNILFYHSMLTTSIAEEFSNLQQLDVIPSVL